MPLYNRPSGFLGWTSVINGRCLCSLRSFRLKLQEPLPSLWDLAMSQWSLFSVSNLDTLSPVVSPSSSFFLLLVIQAIHCLSSFSCCSLLLLILPYIKG